MDCKFCKKKFSSKSSLNNHQKTANYCLKLQDSNDEINNFNCEFCKKIFTTKQSLLTHLNICKEKEVEEKIKEKLKELEEKLKEVEEKLKQKENELKEKEKEIKEKEKLKQKLKQKDEELKEKDIQIAKLNGQLSILKDNQEFIKETAKQPKITTNTTTTNNTLNITSSMDFKNIEKAKSLIDDRLNINYIVDGQKGLARFVKDTLLTDDQGNLLYICTDPSRHIFKYKDSTGEIKKDIEAKKLTSYILDSGIRTKSADIGNQWCKDDDGDIDINKFNIMLEQQQNIMKLRDDNNTFKKELASITS